MGCFRRWAWRRCGCWSGWGTRSRSRWGRPGQTCCGQLHVNSGYPGLALPLVRNHVAAFEGYQAVVVPSGSCTAAVRHQHAEVARQFGDPGLAGAAQELAGRTYELSEFLIVTGSACPPRAYSTGARRCSPVAARLRQAGALRFTVARNFIRCLGETRTPHPKAAPRGGLSAIITPVYFCYLDESGGCEDPESSSSATPVMVILRCSC
jgi:hypothetical protein